MSNKRQKQERTSLLIKKSVEALQTDNKKPQKPDKRPGAGKFLAMYAYIQGGKFDTRYNIPSSWKPHSFSERKQHHEFLHRFIYPYPLPDVLLWASHSPECIVHKNGDRKKALDYEYIGLAKKWINDIVSGKSFYKKNKEYFTKA